jgi:sRNA-binding protein
MSHKKRARGTRRYLASVYPDLFGLDRPVPFALGLKKAIREIHPEIDGLTLDRMFQWLTMRKAYLRGMTAGAPRFGLHGPQGNVSPEAAALAAERLSGRLAREMGRKAAP